MNNMKKILLIFCLILFLSSCGMKYKKYIVDITYGIHYPDTTMIFTERFDLKEGFLDKDKMNSLQPEDCKPKINSYEGTNYISVRGYRVGPETTAPIHIQSYRVIFDN